MTDHDDKQQSNIEKPVEQAAEKQTEKSPTEKSPTEKSPTEKSPTETPTDTPVEKSKDNEEPEEPEKVQGEGPEKPLAKKRRCSAHGQCGTMLLPKTKNLIKRTITKILSRLCPFELWKIFGVYLTI